MMLVVASFAEFKVTRNLVKGTLGFDYGMTTVKDSVDVDYANMGYDLPDVAYEFEGKPNDMFKIFLYGGVGYAMDKASVDGTADDNFASDLDINLNPMVKVYLPNNLFVKVELPFEYISETAATDTAEAIPTMGLDMHSSFGFDKTEIRIHGLTPWNNFVKGMSFYGTFNMALMESVDGEATEELHMYFGVAGCYAHYNDNMMVKSYLSYRMGLNDKVDENGYVNVGVEFAKDFSEQFNLEAGLDFGMIMLPDEDLAGNSSYNSLEIATIANYYVMPELDILGGIGMMMDLTTEDANPVYTIMVGAEYTLNLLK